MSSLLVKSPLISLNSGFNEDIPNNLFMLRSISVNKKTKVLNTQSILNELFHGKTTAYEILGQPSTIIIPRQANVILASQIFHRNFRGAINWESYILDSGSSEGGTRLTWIAAPSIVFSYKNRLTLMGKFNRSCVSTFFNITTFASSSCIRKETEKEYMQGLEYCDKMLELKKNCTSPEYDTHSRF